TATVDHAKGSPQNPLSDDELVAKFRANASGVMDTAAQDRVIEATMAFEEQKDLGAYMQLLVTK
ncbi:MmgE/PrpD family protein, partial [bacterium]